jgi:DNA-binding Lrp family transcriptional regulator
MPTKSWRDVLPIHPAADLFPLMSPDELRVLGADIKANGLTLPIVLWSDGKSPAVLLDGRNRLDAIEITDNTAITDAAEIETAIKEGKAILLDNSVDPYAFVISANIHRRHLSIEDKDRLIVKVLQADPTKSNRQVAELTDTSHPHVAKVREQAEKSGDVETVTTSIDSKGRQQPAKRGWTRERWARHHAKKSGRKTEAATTTATTAKSIVPTPPEDQSHRQDIGPNNAGECERPRERNEELEHERQRLERHNISLRSQIEETKPGLAEKLEPLIETLFEQGMANMVTMAPPVVMIAVTKLERLLVEYGVIPPSRRIEDPQGYIRLLNQRARRRRDKEHAPKTDAAQAATKSNSDAPPEPDDGIPEFLRRAAP